MALAIAFPILRNNVRGFPFDADAKFFLRRPLESWVFPQRNFRLGWAVHITSDNGLLWGNASRSHMQIQKGMALALVRQCPLHRQTSTPFASLQLQRRQWFPRNLKKSRSTNS